MRFEWDEGKNRRNLAKHPVSFGTAQLVFDDPRIHVQEDRAVAGEERWQALGLIGGTVVVLVVHTYREEDGEEVIRIISARKAAAPERRAYDEANESPS
jgi:uncharacterized protein